MSQEHVLEGLEPDNLLAFLALLGLLRSVGHAQPGWRLRVCWDGIPLRPRLHVDAGRSQLLAAAARGCDQLAEVHTFGDRRDLNFTREEARQELAREARASGVNNRLRIDLLTSLMSDGAVKDDETVKGTPFCAMFGQGHQHFLERLESVAKGDVPKKLAKIESRDSLNSTARLEKVLFANWDRCDRTQSFRWDPLEDRRYALRFEDPSAEEGLTVHGANRLASVGIPLFPAVPVRIGNQVRLLASGTSQDVGQDLRVFWPVWSAPAGLHAVRAMIAGGLEGDTPKALGVLGVYESSRISVGKFFNFSRATFRPAA